MTSDLQRAIAERKEKLHALKQDYPERGVKFIQTHMPDLGGLLRTKYSPFKLSEEGDSFNAILYNIAYADGEPVGEVAFDAPICDESNGFRSILALADPESAVIHGWRPETASVMLNTFMPDGSACDLDIRARLKAIETQARGMGFAVSVACEVELGIFHYDEDLIREGRYSELRPYGNGPTNYDVLRAPGYEDLMQEFMRRMESIGAPVSSFTTEYGRGMYEFAMKPLPPLAAADAFTRAKHHMKELCLESGLIATFMTRFQPPGGESACGLHVHQCLVDTETGENLFHSPDGVMSELAMHYGAGLLNTMADMHAIFRPTVNSYRRMERDAWSPEEIFWGVENRLAAVRVINQPTPEACRFEHRCCGSDVNPYLAITAMVGAGLKGIREKWAPDPLVPGASKRAQDERPLPRSLEASVEQMRASRVGREIFGDGLWAQIMAGRENELAAYEAWQKREITRFEYLRYFAGV